MDAEKLTDLIESIQDLEGLYLLASLTSTAGFFSSNKELIYMAKDIFGYSSESIETEYLQLQTHVKITGVKNHQTFRDGYYNLISYKGYIKSDNFPSFVHLCRLHAQHEDELSFKEFFYSLIALFQLPAEQSYKNAVGLFGELKFMQYAQQEFEIDLSNAWHRNGSYSKYDFSGKEACLEVKTTSTETGEISVKHGQLFGGDPCYVAIVTCSQRDSGQTIMDVVDLMQKDNQFFNTLNFNINLAKELKRISPKDAKEIRFGILDIRVLLAANINPFSEVPDTVSSLTYKLDVSDYEGMSSDVLSEFFSHLEKTK